MNIKVTGIIQTIGEPEKVSEALIKTTLILKTVEERPQFYAVEFLGEKAELLKGIKANQIKTVHANLNGREWADEEGKLNYFLSLSGWKIDDYA